MRNKQKRKLQARKDARNIVDSNVVEAPGGPAGQAQNEPAGNVVGRLQQRENLAAAGSAAAAPIVGAPPAPARVVDQARAGAGNIVEEPRRAVGQARQGAGNVNAAQVRHVPQWPGVFYAFSAGASAAISAIGAIAAVATRNMSPAITAAAGAASVIGWTVWEADAGHNVWAERRPAVVSAFAAGGAAVTSIACAVGALEETRSTSDSLSLSTIALSTGALAISYVYKAAREHQQQHPLPAAAARPRR